MRGELAAQPRRTGRGLCLILKVLELGVVEAVEFRLVLRTGRFTGWTVPAVGCEATSDPIAERHPMGADTPIGEAA